MQPFSLIVADSNTPMLQALAELFERDRRFTLWRRARRRRLSRDCLRVPVDIGLVEWTIPQLGAERLLSILRDRPDAPRIIVYAASNDGEVPRRAMAAEQPVSAIETCRRTSCWTCRNGGQANGVSPMSTFAA